MFEEKKLLELLETATKTMTADNITAIIGNGKSRNILDCRFVNLKTDVMES
jgi:hypothetical protein